MMFLSDTVPEKNMKFKETKSYLHVKWYKKALRKKLYEN